MIDLKARGTKQASGVLCIFNLFILWIAAEKLSHTGLRSSGKTLILNSIYTYFIFFSYYLHNI